LSSNIGVEFPHTEAMTLCFRRTGLDATGAVCAACADSLEARGIIANGAATLVRNSLRFMIVHYTSPPPVFQKQ
jgi:hypothetical protein